MCWDTTTTTPLGARRPMKDLLAAVSALLGFPVCMGYEERGIDPPPPLCSHMVISQGRKPLELPESEELPGHVGWRWDGGAVPGWPRACGGGSH